MTGTPRQARSAVTAVFLLNGVIFGTWASRIPAVRDRVGLSDGELGLVLACMAIGAIVAMPLAGGRAAAHRQPADDPRRLRPAVPGPRGRGPRARPAPARAAGPVLRRRDGLVRRRHERARRHRRAPLRAGNPRRLPRGLLARRARRRRARRPGCRRRDRRSRALRARRRARGRGRADLGRAGSSPPTPTPSDRPSRCSCARRGVCSRSAVWPSRACSSRARRATGAASTCATSWARAPGSRRWGSPPSA